MAVVEPGDVDAFLAICAKWDVEAVVIGEVTDTGRLRHRLARRARRRRAPALGRPRRARPTSAPTPAPTGRTPSRPTAPRRCPARSPATTCARRCCAWSRRRTSATSRGSPTSTTATSAATPCSPSRRTAAWCASTTRPTSASRSPPTATAASPSSTRTPAPSSRWPSPTATSPPVAPGRSRSRDCLNFGSPEDPDVMWQFAEACRGLKDGCLELGIPVTGGNVSLYNQTGETAILPTPVVAVLGVIDDVTKRTPSRLRRRGRARLPARRDPRGALRLGVGARRARPPRRPARRGSTSRPRRRWARCWPTRRAMQLSPVPTTCPTVDWRRPWRRPPSATGSGSRCRWPTWPAVTPSSPSSPSPLREPS